MKSDGSVCGERTRDVHVFRDFKSKEGIQYCLIITKLLLCETFNH